MNSWSFSALADRLLFFFQPWFQLHSSTFHRRSRCWWKMSVWSIVSVIHLQFSEICLPFFLLPLVGLVVALCSVLINFMNVRHFVLVLFRLAKSSRGGFLFSLGFCVEVEHFWKCCQQVWNIPQSYKKREKEIEEIPRRISKILKGKTGKLRQHSASWRREKKGKVMDWLFLKQVTNDTRNPLAPPQPRLPLPPPPSRHANR